MNDLKIERFNINIQGASAPFFVVGIWNLRFKISLVVNLVMGVFYFLFDGSDGGVEFGLDVVAPKAEDGPASGGEVLVDFVVTLDVAVDFVFPELGIVDRSFSSVPILAMKKL